MSQGFKAVTFDDILKVKCEKSKVQDIVSYFSVYLSRS